MSQLFSVARHTRYFKLVSKPGWFYVSHISYCCIAMTMTNYTNIIHIHLHMHAEHNGDTIKTSDTVRKIYLSLYLKVLCVRGSWKPNRTATYWPPTLMAISVSFPFSWAAQPGVWGPASLGAGFLYRILSPTGLVSRLLNWRPEDSLYWVLAFSTAYCLQLIRSPNWLTSCLHWVI